MDEKSKVKPFYKISAFLHGNNTDHTRKPKSNLFIIFKQKGWSLGKSMNIYLYALFKV